MYSYQHINSLYESLAALATFGSQIVYVVMQNAYRCIIKGSMWNMAIMESGVIVIRFSNIFFNKYQRLELMLIM